MGNVKPQTFRVRSAMRLAVFLYSALSKGAERISISVDSTGVTVRGDGEHWLPLAEGDVSGRAHAELSHADGTAMLDALQALDRKHAWVVISHRAVEVQTVKGDTVWSAQPVRRDTSGAVVESAERPTTWEDEEAAANWAGRTFGELSSDEQHAATAAAGNTLSAELERGPIDKVAILTKPIDSLLNSGAAPESAPARRAPMGSHLYGREASYRRGWLASVRYGASTGNGPSPLERADSRGEPDAWYDGYHDHAAGRAGNVPGGQAPEGAAEHAPTAAIDAALVAGERHAEALRLARQTTDQWDSWGARHGIGTDRRNAHEAIRGAIVADHVAALAENGSAPGGALPAHVDDDARALLARSYGGGEAPTHVEVHVFHYPTHSMTVQLWINAPGATPPSAPFDVMADGSTFMRYTAWYATRERAEESAVHEGSKTAPELFTTEIITHDHTVPEPVTGELLDPFTITLHATMTADPEAMGFDERMTRSEVIEYGTQDLVEFLLSELTSCSRNDKVSDVRVNGCTMDDDGYITEGN